MLSQTTAASGAFSSTVSAARRTNVGYDAVPPTRERDAGEYIVGQYQPERNRTVGTSTPPALSCFSLEEHGPRDRHHGGISGYNVEGRGLKETSHHKLEALEGDS